MLWGEVIDWGRAKEVLVVWMIVVKLYGSKLNYSV